MRVLEARRWAEERFHSLESPRTDAEWLLCRVTGRKRHEIYLERDRVMSDAELERFTELVEDRSKGVPLQHLTGVAGFMDMEMKVGPGALVPRPETETLVETVLEEMARRPRLIADVGTGSGAIALALARAYPSAVILATDVSHRALRIARANLESINPGNVILAGGNLLGFLSPGTFLDAVVANLPYVPTEEIASLSTEVCRYEPMEALDGGPDGLRVVRALLAAAPAHIEPGGLLCIELDSRQVGAVIEDLESSAFWSTIKPHRDLAGRDRIVSAVRSSV